jgi:hypothetical protein
MARPIVDRTKEMEAVMERSKALLWLDGDLAKAADVHPTTLSRAKTTGRVDAPTLRKLQDALTRAEAERAAA